MARAWLSLGKNGTTEVVNVFLEDGGAINSASVQTSGTVSNFSSVVNGYKFDLGGTGLISVSIAGYDTNYFTVDMDAGTGTQLPMRVAVWTPANHTGSDFTAYVLHNQTWGDQVSLSDLNLINATSITTGLGDTVTSHVRSFEINPTDARVDVEFGIPAGSATSQANVLSDYYYLRTPTTRAALFPNTFPCINPELTYGMSPQSGFYITNMESGRKKLRQKSSVSQHQLSVGWTMTDTEAEAFQDFYEKTLRNGSRAFLMTVNYLGSKRLTECHFLSPPTGVMRGRFKVWDISAQLLCQPIDETVPQA